MQELADAGFQTTRRIDPDGRLVLVAEKDGRQYELRHGAAPFRFVTAFELVDGRPLFDEVGYGALRLVQLLAERQGQHVLEPDPDRVLIPRAWTEPLSNDAGTFLVTRIAGDTRALGVRAIEGTDPDAALSLAARRFFGQGGKAREGLWARVQADPFTWEHEGAESAEEAVAAAEAALARAHALTPAIVRDALRLVVGAVVCRSSDAECHWRFVRRGEHDEPILLRTVVVDDDGDDSLRAPYGAALRNRTVALIGCGSVGWSVALLLARSGVRRFVLYDDDTLEPDNLARLDGYLNQVGRLKVEALAEQLRVIAPGIEVATRPFVVGQGLGVAALVAAKPDLLVNLTGEEVGTEETNRAALVRGLDDLHSAALFAWVSNGVLGARIVRVRPWRSACYLCVRQASPRPIPTSGLIVERSLWRGAAHDLELFAAAVARAAVLTLIGEPVSAANPDHVVLRFGGPVPACERIAIPRDPSCEDCGR